ncbi:MAG: ATP-binding cassette domain-containing protein, partial [Bosea sp. (in: a-proteobacteria)]
ADKASQRIDVRLANRLHARMLGAKLQTRQASSGMQANTLREYETLREIFASTTLTVLGDIPFALLFLAVMAVIAGPLALVALLAIPVIILANVAVNWPLARLQERAFRDTAIKNTIIVETLNGLETLKAMGAEPWAAQRYEKAVAEHLRVGLWSRVWATLGLNLVMTGQAIATIVAVIYGCLLVARGDMTGGALMASMMLIGRVLGPFSQIAAIASKLHSARLAWRAVKDMALAPQERGKPHAFVTLPEALGTIRAEDVTFSYDPQMPAALQRINLTIQPGERVGFIGGVGSGKSSLLKLLLKLHEPNAGRILISDLALNDIDPLQLRHRIGFCGQNPQLFQGSLRQNLTLHRPGASDADILASAATTGAMGWISRMPRGLDTLLAENGAGLSGGQRQSIALTRALIGAPDMLLLDEPTSDMDGRMEAHIVEQLKNATGQRTLILVTHRPALLELVDRLVVFEGGRIMADGPKANVLKTLQEQARKPADTSAEKAA